MLYGKEHVDRYVATNGEEGYIWRDAPTLILTTTGRKSGEQRSTPLIFGTHGNDYLIVGSKGGSPTAPAWYGNLQADPDVHVQVKGDRFKAHARTASEAEKPELWKLMTAVWPAYNDYQKRTERVIPVVILTRD